MNIKLLGALCIVVGCAGVGFVMASQYRRQIQLLKDLISALAYMENEISFRGTPLPQLCARTGDHVRGRIGVVFAMLAEELDAQVSPNVQLCMHSVLKKHGCGNSEVDRLLRSLGDNLGKFDRNGQLRALADSSAVCKDTLRNLQVGKELRIRSYQTLGLCAGAAIVILLV